MVKGITRMSIVEDNILYSKKVPITHEVDLVRKVRRHIILIARIVSL